ncbi:MAG: helix-turn-helix transcriptional regulator [Bacteroides sp.]
MNRIKELRKQNNYSQQALANALFVNQTAVSQWERGATYPEQPTLIRLAELFDVSTDYLLGISDKKKPFVSKTDTNGNSALANASAETQKIMDLLEQLEPENQKKALDHLDYLLARQAEREEKK